MRRFRGVARRGQLAGPQRSFVQQADAQVPWSFFDLEIDSRPRQRRVNALTHFETTLPRGDSNRGQPTFVENYILSRMLHKRPWDQCPKLDVAIANVVGPPA
jgi:hypothetical protein